MLQNETHIEKAMVIWQCVRTRKGRDNGNKGKGGRHSLVTCMMLKFILWELWRRLFLWKWNFQKIIAYIFWSYSSKLMTRKCITNYLKGKNYEPDKRWADHASKHATKTPHIQRVVIILQIHKELRSLERSGKNKSQKNKINDVNSMSTWHKISASTSLKQTSWDDYYPPLEKMNKVRALCRWEKSFNHINSGSPVPLNTTKQISSKAGISNKMIEKKTPAITLTIIFRKI